MAIRISGTVGDLKIDLTIESDPGELAQEISSVFSKLNSCDLDGSEDSGTTEAGEQSKAGESALEKAERLALFEINDRGQINSFELMNLLSKSGIDDLTIKRCLLFLREKGEVEVTASDDGLQRNYRKKAQP